MGSERHFSHPHFGSPRNGPIRVMAYVSGPSEILPAPVGELELSGKTSPSAFDVCSGPSLSS
jgi:hypothetical protein